MKQVAWSDVVYLGKQLYTAGWKEEKQRQVEGVESSILRQNTIFTHILLTQG